MTFDFWLLTKQLLPLKIRLNIDLGMSDSSFIVKNHLWIFSEVLGYLWCIKIMKPPTTSNQTKPSQIEFYEVHWQFASIYEFFWLVRLPREHQSNDIWHLTKQLLPLKIRVNIDLGMSDSSLIVKNHLWIFSEVLGYLWCINIML